MSSGGHRGKPDVAMLNVIRNIVLLVVHSGYCIIYNKSG